MIEFFTFFLGLASGIHSVEMIVLEPVVEVELQLDGHRLGTMVGEPWSLDVDLGDALAPHDLVAIGRDSEGQELDRIRQWINLAAADAEALSDEASEGAEQSPLAVTLEPGVQLPSAAEMSTWFLAAGEPVAVVAVENGPAEVVIVRDPAVQPELFVLADSFFEAKRGFLAPTLKGAPPETAAWSEGWIDLDPAEIASPYQARLLLAAQKGLRQAGLLGPGAEVRFLSPWAAPLSHVQSDRKLFAVSDRIEVKTKGFLEITNEVTSLPFAFRLADAVALAASEVHDAGRRRAVLVLLGEEQPNAGLYTPAQARDYARDLQVPLWVWSMAFDEPRRKGKDEVSEWGEVQRVGFNPNSARSTWAFAFDRAVRDLRQHLASQRIVWLEGRHLPQSIELSAAARGLRLAGDPGAPP